MMPRPRSKPYLQHRNESVTSFLNTLADSSKGALRLRDHFQALTINGKLRWRHTTLRPQAKSIDKPRPRTYFRVKRGNGAENLQAAHRNRLGARVAARGLRQHSQILPRCHKGYCSVRIVRDHLVQNAGDAGDCVRICHVGFQQLQHNHTSTRKTSEQDQTPAACVQ